MAGTKQGSMDSPDKDTGMPPNLRKTSGGYQYRRVVPADLREAIGKREIKKNLGSVYSVAKKLHAQLEVETNALFAAARATDGQLSDAKQWVFSERRGTANLFSLSIQCSPL